MTPQQLADVDRICRLKHRYLRLLDGKRWDDIADCFVPEATAAFSDGRITLGSRDEIVAFYRRAMDSPTLLTNHRVHHPEIELTGPDTAIGVWALDDEVIALEHGSSLRGAAFYRDRFARTEDGWRIVHTGYERVYELVEPHGSGLRVTANRFVAGPGHAAER